MNDHVTLPDGPTEEITAKQGARPPAQPQAPSPAAPGIGDPAPKTQSGRRRWAMGLGAAVLVVLAASAAWGIWGHAQRNAAAQAALQQLHDAVPQVRVAAVKMLDTPRQIDLPGSMQAFVLAPIFARATGYIRSRAVDIGSKVHEGDLLAVIASPDLDQQLSQAQATLTQTMNAYTEAVANRKVAGQTEVRTAALVKRGWTSKQQGDVDFGGLASNNANVLVSKAALEAQAAQVRYLVQLVAYDRVLAPFNGVITVRDIDIGNLVVANTQTGTEMFTIASSEVLRVQVYVPQEDYFSVKDGSDVAVTVPELPGRVFQGKVTRNASALQSGTRTLLVEVDLDNRDGVLTAGLYGVVHLNVPRVTPVALVPSQAIIFNQDGLNAAVYDNGILRLRHLDVLVDDGAQLEAQAGLKPGDLLVLNPPQIAKDGMRVMVEPAAEKPK